MIASLPRWLSTEAKRAEIRANAAGETHHRELADGMFERFLMAGAEPLASTAAT